MNVSPGNRKAKPIEPTGLVDASYVEAPYVKDTLAFLMKQVLINKPDDPIQFSIDLLEDKPKDLPNRADYARSD